MFIIIILILFLFSILACLFYFYNQKSENWSQKDAHLIAHFGGIPNMSQIWPYLVKYPKEYV